MVRRRVAAGVGVVLLIVIVLVVNGCLKSQAKQSLETYNRDVSRIAQESDQQVSKPLFAALTDASAQVGARRRAAARPTAHPGPEPGAAAKGLSVPGAMAGAQRDLLLALDLRAEGLAKVAASCAPRSAARPNRRAR